MALLGVLAVAAGFALAKNGPPTPTIASHPVNPTTSTSASFTFGDLQANVTFACALDGSSYTACTSAKTYSGLAPGSHTFQVEAKDTSGNASNPASFSWTIDLTPPAIAIAFGANGGTYNASGWNAGCSGAPGVCGTASDPSGVSAVAVSIKNPAGKYWGGTSYSSSTELYNNSTLSTGTTSRSWRYALPLPSPDGDYTLHVKATDALGNQTPSGSPSASVFTIATAAPPAPSITAKPANPTNQTSASFSFTDSQAGVSYLCRIGSGAYSACSSPKSYNGLSQGTYTVFVEAKDVAGNVSSATTYTWVIDTTPPPTPTITQHPTDPTSSSTATFAFTDSKLGVSFQCQLDGSARTACTSPATYTGLGARQHDFYVRAVDAAGNVSAAAHFEFDVTQSTGQPFTISGSTPSPLYPGAAGVAIPVKLTNPNSVPIFVTSVTVTVQSTSATGCSTSWFSITQSTIPAAGVQIPANGSVTLPAQSSTAPSLRMIESGTNQNACASATLTLGYTGSAHS